jgi:hypothetical protein
MHSLKFWVATVLWLLLVLPLAVCQTTPITSSNPKWDFGLRGGAGFSSIHLDNRQPFTEYFRSGGGRIRYENSNPKAELYLGAYATRHFGQKWSLRSELSLVSKSYEGMSLSMGVFPRYQLTKWMKLETGFETRVPLSVWGRSETRFAIGAAFGRKDVEFNVRFAPSYQPASPFNRGSTWLGAFQAGASFKLASVGKVFRGKKS